MVGQTIQHYEVVEELGRGGMGVVYKARDTRLNRSVAIKLLSPQKSADPDGRQRFIQEARAASALNHPNIVTIYEINKYDEADFIAMEFVPGQTLDKLIPSRGLPLGDLLHSAIQIASALAAAHAAGIVHRDLKPGNVMVTSDGRLKVLDFGLAKLSDRTLTENQDTLTFVIPDRYLTSDGFVVGTVSYMSPEQAEGRRVDTRSDVFSFGSLLYEMATGCRAFDGESTAAVMASLLRDEPRPLSEIAPAIPAELQRIIHRCLRKEPARRVQHMDDIMLDLEELKLQHESGRQRTASATGRPWPRLKRVPAWQIALAALALVAVVVAWFAGTSESRPGPPTLAPELLLTRLAGAGGETRSPSWSPDGRWVAYSSDHEGSADIWKQPVEGGEAIPLTGGPGNEHNPSWSPDGRTIAYSLDADGGGIYLIAESGGAPTRLVSFGDNPRFSPDGRLIAFDQNGDIYVVPATGGEPRAVIEGTSAVPYTAWAPDSSRIVFWDRTQTDIFAASVAGEPDPKPLGLVPLGDEVTGLAWSSDGNTLVYGRGPFGGNKDLWRVRVDPSSARRLSAPERLTLSATDDGDCAFSPDGTRVAYAVRRIERHLWRLDRDPQTGLTTGLGSRITRNGQLNYYPAVSPDGRLLVWTSHASGRGQLYYKRFNEERARKLTRDWNSEVREVGAAVGPDGQVVFSSTLEGSFELWRVASLDGVSIRFTRVEQPAKDSLPSIAPDGGAAVFYSNRSGSWGVWKCLLGPGQEPGPLVDWPGNEIYPSYSPNGRSIAFTADKNGTPDVWVVDADGGNARPLFEHPAEEAWPIFSPDGRFLYFTSNIGGTFGVWVMPAGGGEPRPVPTLTGPANHMPDVELYTKIAVTKDSLIVPLESRKSDLYVLALP